MTVATTLAAAVAFAAFHMPLPARRAGRWGFVRVSGMAVPLLGIAYHVLMLPAVAALPAPAWAVAAGFAWMFLDLALEGAGLAGTTIDVRSLREGVHLVACVWVLAAGWHSGPVLGVAGTLLAAAFLARLGLRALRGEPPAWLLSVNAALNVVWIVVVAVALA
ncbi:MAG TPA: hypothetical protein VGC04_11485 [Cellulomonas sp.]